MIRINLLSEGRRPVVARRSKPTFGLAGQDPSLLMLIAGVLVGLLVAGGWWWILKGELDDVNEAVAAAQAEVEELRPIIEEVEAFKAKQADLENKIRVIKELKQKQKGPVQIMDQVSRSVPELLWLNRMTLNGNAVTLAGNAFNTNAIASFIENLSQVPEFQEPDTRNVVRVGGGTSYSFTINFSFVQALPEESVDGTDTVEEADAP